jgi:MFS family permease
LGWPLVVKLLPIASNRRDTVASVALMLSRYYGWKVVAALFLAGFMVYGGGLYCFVLFVPRIEAEFGWSHAATNGLFSVFWLTAPFTLLGGYAMKRFGVEKLLVAGVILEALCVIVLATVSSLWQMYLLRILMGFGKVMFAVTLPYAISRWFSRKFSLPLGIGWAGWHIGGLVLAPLVSLIIEHYGWRAACFAIGGGLLTIGLLPMAAALRVRFAADLGLGPDGEPLESAEPTPGSKASGSTDALLGSLGDVLRSPMFLLVAIVTVLYYSTYGGLLAQEATVVEGAGFTPRLASLVLGSTAGFAAVGGLFGGWVLDRYSISGVGLGIYGVMLIGAIALLAVARLHSPAALIVYAVAFGTAIGASDLYFVALLRRRFAGVSVAYIYSAWYFCELMTLSLAPIAWGRLSDLSGNYDRTLTMLVVTSVLAWLLGIPAMREAPESSIRPLLPKMPF